MQQISPINQTNEQCDRCSRSNQPSAWRRKQETQGRECRNTQSETENTYKYEHAEIRNKKTQRARTVESAAAVTERARVSSELVPIAANRDVAVIAADRS